MSADRRRAGYGLIGCGAFGRFCLDQYRAIEDVDCVAVADLRPEAARDAARPRGLAACASPAELLARDDIDWVHIATPPSTHRGLALEALDAGKHVLCEKPLATRPDHAETMARRAREKGRVLAVNLIMRHNPLCEQVKRLLDKRLLGEPLHASFVNCAKDEPLPAGHWFWNRDVSGGIFIEHGVHFFDLFRWWLGEGEILSAQATPRPGTNIEEQVLCTARYGRGVLVSFYHGFHQASRMDRQAFRIVCERGDIRLFEWVPTRVEIDVLATEETKRAIAALLPDADVRRVEAYEGLPRKVTSRHKAYEVDGRYAIRGDAGMAKEELYGHVLRGLLSDQIAGARDPAHARRVTENDGLVSLAMAARADALARERSTRIDETVG
jgi:predicted dehydrogenase